LTGSDWRGVLANFPPSVFFPSMTAYRFLPLLAAFALVSPSWAGFEIVQEVETEQPVASTTTITTQIDGKMMRVDMGRDASSIVDTESGDIITLMHPQKVFVRMPGSMAKAMAQAATGQESQPSANFQKTGRTDTINGFFCEEYTGTIENGTIAMWVSKNTPIPQNLIDQLTELGSDFAPIGGGDDKVEGYPIRVVIESGDTGRSVITTLSVVEKKISPDQFKTPSGYRSMDIPSGVDQLLQQFGQ
jgi:hypothetical protein